MTRLIDADKLKRYIDTCEFCGQCPDTGFLCYRRCELPDCLTSQWERVIDEQPTVDAVPVRHGKWLPREEGVLYPFWERYTCSECGKHSDDTRYCPNCGARMDAERKEE